MEDASQLVSNFYKMKFAGTEVYMYAMSGMEGITSNILREHVFEDYIRECFRPAEGAEYTKIPWGMYILL